MKPPFIDFWNPTYLLVGAAVLTILATWVTNTRQTENDSVISQQNGTMLDLLQQMAAQSGNQDAVSELIEVRTKALAAPPAETASELLARVPGQIENYNRLRAHNAGEAGRRATEYRLMWEPYARFIAEEFDRRSQSIQERGIDLKLTSVSSWQVVGIDDGGPTQVIRTVEHKGVVLQLSISSAQAYATHLNEGIISLFVGRGTDGTHALRDATVCMYMLLGLENASVDPRSFPGHIVGETTTYRSFPGSRDGKVAPELIEVATSAINKGIEQLLVLAGAGGH